MSFKGSCNKVSSISAQMGQFSDKMQEEVAMVWVCINMYKGGRHSQLVYFPFLLKAQQRFSGLGLGSRIRV